MISEQFNTAEGKKLFAGLASELLDKKKPGIYNQAIMDFGATVCKPVPLCESCALRKYCLSFQKGMQLAFPVKAKRAKKRNRWFYYFLIEDHGRIYYRKRTERDIWQNLHEFILFESGQLKESSVAAEEVFGKGNFLIKSKSPPYSQTLTHQEVQAVFIHGGLKAKGRIPKGYSAASPAMLRRKAFPRIISRYLSETGFLRKASGI